MDGQIHSETSNLLRVKNPKALKSIIFISRVFYTMKTLKIQSISSKLKYVIENILFIIENCVAVTKKGPKCGEKRKGGKLEPKSKKGSSEEPKTKRLKKESSVKLAQLPNESSMKKTAPLEAPSALTYTSHFTSLPSPDGTSSVPRETSPVRNPYGERMDRLESFLTHGRDVARRLTSFFDDGLSELDQLRQDTEQQEERIKAKLMDAFQKSLDEVMK